MTDKHAEKIEYVKTKGLFKNFNFSKYFTKNPPKNSSLQTYQELRYLADLPEDVDFVEKHDDVPDVFKEVCQEHGLEFPEDLVKELAKSCVLHELKYHYNRPRPFQLAEYYNIKLGEHVMESMKTPSYPSGHSAQGFLIGKILQLKLPINTDAFLEAGKRISYSRNIGRAHYPSDSRLGEDIGDAMFRHIRDKI
jgi:hypothetical protein